MAAIRAAALWTRPPRHHHNVLAMQRLRRIARTTARQIRRLHEAGR
jgi:hypothetical protein